MYKNLFLFLILSAFSLSVSAKELLIRDYFDLVKSEGYSLGDKQHKMYQFLMAVDGYGMKVDGETIEVYEFDLSVKTGQTALEKLKTDGFMGSGIIVNKNLALMKKKKHPKWEELKELFLSL